VSRLKKKTKEEPVRPFGWALVDGMWKTLEDLFEKMSPKTPQKLLCSVVGFADFEKILLFLKKTMEKERGMCYNIKNVMWGSRALS